jgi:hypothetical protein
MTDATHSPPKIMGWIFFLMFVFMGVLYVVGRHEGAKTYQDQHPCSVPGTPSPAHK